MRSIFRLAIIALALTTAACVQHVDQDNNGGDIGSDASSDGATDAESDVEDDTAVDAGRDTEQDVDQDTGSNVEVIFELVNNSGRPIYAAPSPSGTYNCHGHGWLDTSQGDATFGLFDDSCVTNCDSDDGPIACDLDCAAPTEQDYRLGDGQKRSVTWDGIAWTTRDGCEVSESLEGESASARFCYGSGFDDQSAQLLDETCETVEFAVDQPTQTVRVTVDELQPQEITFRMVNETGRDLYANPGTPTQAYTCYGEWYTLGTGTRVLTPVQGCDGTCACDEVEQNPDEQCSVPCPARAPCAAPTREALLFEAGTTLSDTWDGLVTFDDQVEGQACHRRAVPLADDLVATFCYAEDVDESSGYAELKDPVCSEVAFQRTTNDIIELRVE